MRSPVLPGLIVALALAACEPQESELELIFVDGRAVAPALDSVFAITALGVRGVLLHNRHGATLDTLGAEELASPAHTQWMDGRWYVSDVRDGAPAIVVFGPDGSVEQSIDLRGIATAPHQFAVLEGGHIVVEGPDNRLVQLDGDSATTFALFEGSSRTGLLVGALGGVLHAVPGKTIALYNGLGNIRWRLEWPWADNLYAADLAVDAQGRAYILAGVQQENVFIVFGFSPVTGEVIRWSEEGPLATFVVRRLGEIRADSAEKWVGRLSSR